MKSIKSLLALLCLASLTGMMPASAQTAREIVQKILDRNDGDTRSMTIELKLTNKNGKTRVRKLVSYSMDIGKDKKTIMFFTYPGDVKGTSFLTWDYDDVNKEDDKWLYLPAMKRTRRISSGSAKKDYFMGTDFTYDDMGKRNIEEDTHKIIKESETIDGHDCWQIEFIPKDKNEIYSKRLLWVRKDCLIPLKAEYYDKLGKLHRVLHIDNVKQVDGIWTFGHESMENVQRKHRTDIYLTDQHFNIDLDKGIFTVVRMEKGL